MDMERADAYGYTKLQQLSSWPSPRMRPSSTTTTSHICGYCKREFRSAQGLGGHMNVHRLDRARLIHHQYSSHHHLALVAPPPNPNPSHAVAELLGSGGRTHGAVASDGAGSAALPATEPGVCRRFSLASSSASTKDIEVMKNLELSMGACSHGDGAEERLDLELRLGYP